MEGRETENRGRVSNSDHIGLKTEEKCEMDTVEERAKRKRGDLVNWTPAHISCPLDWVSGGD